MPGQSAASPIPRTINTPLGAITAAASSAGLVLLDFSDNRAPRRELADTTAGIARAIEPGANSILDQTGAELSEYFAGARRTFTVPLDLCGTAFQVSVWDQLLRIPFGETRTYVEVARALGNPSATRAVGAANGRNPIAIIVPCHRVIAADGTLWGYGGGLERKRWLLEHEGALPRTTASEPGLFAAYH